MDNLFLHTMMGTYKPEFEHPIYGETGQIRRYKFDSFLAADNTSESIERHLAFPQREVMCSISSPDMGFSYHKPYGLILEGNIRAIYEDDAGLRLRPDGTYDLSGAFSDVERIALEDMPAWLKRKAEDNNDFVWNDTVLEKGAKIIGAFHDPSYSPSHLRNDGLYTQQEEYALFLDKIAASGIKLIGLPSNLLKYSTNE